jgi:integrase
MQTFTDWISKTPDELITEAEQEATILMRKRKITTYLIGFKKYLQEKKLAPLSQKSYLTGVKSFYQFNYIELPKLKSEKAKPLKKNNDIPTKEDIQEILKVCEPLEKAIVLIGVSSGLSANEIINLKVEDFKKGYDPVTEVTTLDLRRQKGTVDFITFLTHEASRSVNEYLKCRSRTVKT